MLEVLFSSLNATRILEIMAAIAAIISYIFYKNHRTNDFKFLLIYLWFVVLVEFLGSYAHLICPFKLDETTFLIQNPQFLYNYWIFNVYLVIAYIFYAWYFLLQIKNEKYYRIGLLSILIFTIVSIIHLITSDTFFDNYSQLVNFMGLVLLILLLTLYYYNILKSDKILNISSSLPFYVSIGVLIFYLCVIPLLLSSKFLVAEEIIFVKYYGLILAYSNYVLYGMFIFGFLRCYWFNKSLNTKSSLSSTL